MSGELQVSPLGVASQAQHAPRWRLSVTEHEIGESSEKFNGLTQRETRLAIRNEN